MAEMSSGDLLRPFYAFAGTEHGATLASRVRYERYKPDGIDNMTWRRMLGVDVNNLGHLQLSANLARKFVRDMSKSSPGYFSSEEEAILVMAGEVHDCAESIVGDTTFSDKTVEDDLKESKEFNTRLDEFFPGISDEDRGLIEEALAEVIFTKDGKLGEAFNVVERVGYVRTALRASSHILAGTAGESENGLRWLVADVLSNHPSQLLTYSTKYPPVRVYLSTQRRQIEEAFNIVKPIDFNNFPPVQRESKVTDFLENRNQWRDWCNFQDLRRLMDNQKVA